ncbi:MAG: hypothetical protein Q4F54_00040 [Coriobacteriia bacterium]|nr:hypothetical protein [Coriobacteriia bacterium]
MPANYVLCNPAYGSEFLGWKGLPEDGKIEGNVTITALVGKVTKINAAIDTENSSGDISKCIVTDLTTKKVSSLTKVKQDFDPESHGGTNILQFTNPIYVDEAGYVNYAYVEAGADPETVFIR